MPTCEKCGSDLVEDNSNVDTTSMSEGEYADFEAGFWRGFYCTKCEKSYFLEGDFGHIDNGIPDDWEDETEIKEELLNITKTKRDQIKGHLTEYLAKQFFERDSGMAIKLLSPANMQWYLNENEIYAKFSETMAKKLVSDIKKVLKGVHTTKDSMAGVPDFLVSKDKEIFFIECKGVQSDLRPEQQKVFKALEKRGYKVLVFEIDMTIPKITFGQPRVMKWTDKKKMLRPK